MSKCMDCNKEFAGAPSDRRCGACVSEQVRKLTTLPEKEQDELIAKALEKAARKKEEAEAEYIMLDRDKDGNVVLRPEGKTKV